MRNFYLRKLYGFINPAYIIWFFVIIFAAGVRIYNLDYNSPFNDEAIYVVIGKLGVFEWDWWSYNAQAWIAGLPYVYPTLTSLAYTTGGIVASRFLNVLLGLLLIGEAYRFTYLLHLFDEKTNQKAALLSSAVVAFSSTGMFLSRFATYDMLSILLLLVSMNFLLKAPSDISGRYYFLGALSLLLSTTTKIITGVYAPFVVAFSYLRTKTLSFPHGRFWKIYFLFPFLIGVLLYALINFFPMLGYLQSQSAREYVSYSRILSTIWMNTYIVLIFAVPSFFLLWFHGKRKEIVLLVFFSCVMPLIHLLTHRWSTLDKHTFFIVLFLAPVCGYAASLLWKIHPPLPRGVAMAACALILFIYSSQELRNLRRLENEWVNASPMLQAMQDLAKPGDKVLTENGAATILALYEKIYPPDVTTLDWIEYRGIRGDEAYIQAVRDGYFNLIELDGRSEVHTSLTRKLWKELGNKYVLKYSESPFEIYARQY